MKLNEFFAKSKQKNFFDAYRIINIIWPAQPAILFLQSFLSCIKELQQKPLVVCDLQIQTSAEIQSQLATSFLGNSFLYAISLSSESTKTATGLLAYLETYEGVHLVILCTAQDEALRERADVLHVFIDEEIDYTTYCSLYNFLKREELPDKRFAQELFRRSQNIVLDMACVMIQYQLLVGKNSQQFFATWFDRIVEQKQSLFLLSQYLFARDQQRFYHAWNQVMQEYPSEFWIAFWSEQLWQAITFITLAQQNGAQVAKKSVSRLPFSFMQKDWHKHTLEELILAHSMLYSIDRANKNGAVTEGLDVWYAKFLI